MTDRRPLYLLSPSNDLAERVASRFGLGDDSRFDAAADFQPADAREPGIVLIDADALPAEDVLALIEALATGAGEWTPVLLHVDRGEDEAVVVRTLSAGFAGSLEDVERARMGDAGALLELRSALAWISRARHDINNPLTSGLAETQLLLLDVEADDPARESLLTIQTQLRRIRDLVAATAPLRLREEPEDTP